MTKKKVLSTATEVRKAVERAVERWVRACRTELGFSVSNSGTSILVTLGTTKPKTCLCIKHDVPELTSVQKNEIRNFFAKLAEMFGLKLVARQLRGVGKKMVALFEVKQALA